MNSTSLSHDYTLVRHISWDNLTSVSKDKEEARKSATNLLYATGAVKRSESIIGIEFGEGDAWFEPNKFGKWEDQVPLYIHIKKGVLPLN